MRLELMKTAFEKFHADSSMVSIKLYLPASIMEGCSSLEELDVRLLPYQTEVLAAEIDYRLNPFLPYQSAKFTREELLPVFEKAPYKFAAAHFLGEAVKACSMSLQSVTDIVVWLQTVMLLRMLEGVSTPLITIHDGSGNTHLTVLRSSITIPSEDYEDIAGKGNDRRNCFGIVTCPLYPKPFGRYSADVIIVMSRMRDFTALDPRDRRKIRRACNSVYRDYGVEIHDLEEDKQPDGLWIPKYLDGRSE